MQIEQKQNCFLMLYAQLIVYNKYSWLFSENPTHFRRGLLKVSLVLVSVAAWIRQAALKLLGGI